MPQLRLQLPDASLFAAIDEVARSELGADDLEGAALGHAVRAVSDAYLRKQGSPAQLRGDRHALCARLKFFLPRDFAKVQAPLRELAAVSALPRARCLRVLDLGAGLGASSLGAAAFALQQPEIERVSIDALDADEEALAIAARLAVRWAAARALRVQFVPRRARLEFASLPAANPPYHVIVAGFVFNELSDGQPDPTLEQQRWLEQLSSLLTEDGVIVVLEPALRVTSRRLQQLRSAQAAANSPPYVFAPCLHQGACPLLVRDRDWCHEQLRAPFPPRLAALADAAGLSSSELLYSYLTLHRVRRSLAELAPDARLHRIVSAPRPSKGKLELYVCGEGGEHMLRRLDRHATPHNRILSHMGRGSVVRLESAESDGSVLQVRAQTRAETLLHTAVAE